MTTSMHVNSIAAYHEEKAKLNKRAGIIFEFLATHPVAHTDRQIMTALHYAEPNAVRPRITEMIKVGLLQEFGSARCEVTGRPVRLVQIKPPPVEGTPTQGDLFS